MSHSFAPSFSFKNATHRRCFVLLPGLFMLLFMNSVYAQLDKLSPAAVKALKQAYDKSKSPEISFQQFAQINAHVYENMNRDESTLAAQDPYCTKVRTYCTNATFETGLDQNQYVGAYGFWNHFGQSDNLYPDPFSLTYGFSSGALNDGAAHQTIVDTTTGNDPITNIRLTPSVPSTANRYALRLGNIVTGYGTELIAKTIIVDPSETILSFSYAVVFQDPGHPVVDQPAFSVRVYDCATGTELPNVCNLGNNSNTAVSNAANPFFKSLSSSTYGTIAYRDWSTAQINLSAYVGKTVIIVFTNKDCGQGAHWGYTYLDNLFSDKCPITGSATTTGDVKLDTLHSSACGTGTICVKYLLPYTVTNNVTTYGFDTLVLDIYQNSTLVKTLTSPKITSYSSDSSYCFSINPATLGINTSLGGFDYAITGKFTASTGFILSPKTILNPPTGSLVPGVNNDYLVNCVVAGPTYYSKSTGDLHNVLTWGLNLNGSGPNPSDFNDSTFQLANRPSGLYTMTADWTVNGGRVNIPGGSQLQINGFTFAISELDPAGTGTISGSNTSNLTVIGTNGNNIGLSFTSGSNTLSNFTVNRTGAGATATLGNALNLLNVLTLTSGTLNTGGFLTLKSTAANTARVAPVISGISGDVTVERYIPARRAWRILSAPVGGIATGAAVGQASLTHSQEPGATQLTTSTGDARPLSYGTATFSLNAAQTAMTMTATVYNIDVTGSQTPDVNDNLGNAHIHVGAAPGSNAAVRWGFFGSPDNDINPKQLVVTPFASGVGGTFTSTWDLNEGNSGTTLTSNLPGILAGLSYINFHTTQFAGGEIRGQITLVGAGTQTINQAWQEGAILGSSAVPNPFPGYGTHITGGPIYGSIANGFDQNPVPGAESSIKRYNPLSNNWEEVPNTNATYVGSDAFMTFIRGDRGIPLGYNNVPPTTATLRAKGALKTGDQVFQVAGTGFTGIPNPFASPINFASITRSGVQNNFYVWDPKMGGDYGVGAYVLLSDNGMGGYTITPAPVSPESQYIQSGQGFLVRPAVAGTAGSITIKESDKSATAATDVFRTSSPVVDAPRFVDPNSGQGWRITLKGMSVGAPVPVLDEVLVSYHAIYKTALDDLDAVKMENVQENLGMVRESQVLMVERKPLPQGSDVVELKLWNTKAQTYLLEINPVNLTSTGLSARLEDKYLKTSTPVNLAEGLQVSFAVGTDAASARTDRFRLVIGKGLDALTMNKSNITAYPNPLNGRELTLAFADKVQGAYLITVSNVSGQTILRKSLQHPGGTVSHTLQLPANLAKGVYRVRVSNNEEETSFSITNN